MQRTPDLLSLDADRQQSAAHNWQLWGLLALLALLLARLALMTWLPLTDTTEARYAEIARKMLETGDWVTPLHDYGVPFWAKPPLSTWLSALSMGALGQSEFAVRLPSLLMALGVLWLTADLARSRSGKNVAMITALILAGSLLFFVAAGAVMTDPALLFSTTLIQVAFWQAVSGRGRYWGYLFFIGVGLGLLAKGPIALVLTGLPIFSWVLMKQRWLPVWERLPWLTGSLLSLVIALPWYLLAELRTPGFIEYFIVGEHVSRFLDPGWQGDRYGFAHATPHGMIWLYAIGALLPWSLIVPLWLFKRSDKLREKLGDADGWLLYLLLWTVMTPAFFSLSGNIIFPYALPMLPGACLLFAELWNRARCTGEDGRWLWPIAFPVTLAAAVLITHAAMPDQFLRTQKSVILQWEKLQPAANSQLVYWGKRREFSAEFYSAGRAKTTHDAKTLEAMIAAPSRDFLVIEAEDMRKLPSAVQQRFDQLAEVEVKGEPVLIFGEHMEFIPELSDREAQ